jgi:hypothetical protein
VTKAKKTEQLPAGSVIGNFTILRTELVRKNKTWVCQCLCGKEKVFWKYSAIQRQLSCGCCTDSCGLTGKQRRSIKLRMQGYKNGALKRNFEWGLTYEEFVDISTKPCFYCGIAPKKWDCMTSSPSLQKDTPKAVYKDYEIEFTGVDRVDSSKGYLFDNCVACCVYCNRAKSDLPLEVFKEHVERMYKWLYQAE